MTRKQIEARKAYKKARSQYRLAEKGQRSWTRKRLVQSTLQVLIADIAARPKKLPLFEGK